MESTTQVLIVAHKTAATPPLIEAIGDRVSRGPCAFTLLVPRNPDSSDPAAEDHILELAIPQLEAVTGGQVAGLIGDSDPFIAVREVLRDHTFDECIVSTLPAGISRWLGRDVPSRIRKLGVPVTIVTAPPRVRPPSALQPSGRGRMHL